MLFSLLSVWFTKFWFADFWQKVISAQKSKRFDQRYVMMFLEAWVKLVVIGNVKPVLENLKVAQLAVIKKMHLTLIF